MAGFLGGGSGGAGATMGAASPVTGAANAVAGGQYSILPIINKILGIGGPPPAASSPAPAPAPTATPPATSTAQSSQQINTQQHQPGFHGLVPMGLQYFQNHQAKMRDAQAQTHLDALQDPSVTPEQRQYHVSGLQNIYSGQPDVLSKLGLGAPAASGGYNVPSVAPAATPTVAAAPTISGGR